MPMLMITCPQKRRALPTNTIVRTEALDSTELGERTIGPCPHCGGRHTWRKEHAYFVGSRPVRGRVGGGK